MSEIVLAKVGRKMLSSNAPYDAKAAYIESTGTQYLVFPDEDRYGVGAVVEYDIQVTSSVSRQVHGFSPSTPNYWGVQVQAGNIYYELGGAFRWTLPAGNRDTVVWSYGSERSVLTVGSSDPISIENSSPISSSKLGIFSLPNNPRWNMSAKLFALRILLNGVLKHDMIPVKKDGVGYLYDRANPSGGPCGNGLYGSTSESPFIAGPDANA